MEEGRGPGAKGDTHLTVFSMDGQRYALPLSRVRRVHRVVAVTPLPSAPALVMGVVDLSGEVLPVIDLRARFGHPARSLRLADQLLVAFTGRRTVALWVDDTLGVVEASPEMLQPARDILPHLDLVQGAVRLDDGLVLIHDLGRLLSLDDEAALDQAFEVARAASDALAASASRESAGPG